MAAPVHQLAPPLAPGWRPDPRRGVFETLLTLDGRPVEREAHLSRLRSSLAALFPAAAPDLTPPAMTSGEPAGRGALRIVVAPDGDGALSARFERRPAAAAAAVALRSVALPGGLGAHKWVDRAPLEAMQAELPADTLPLIVDDGGGALEAARANLFALRGRVLTTPPLDGRILPGVSRRRVLEVAPSLGLEAREAALSLDDLAAAEEVFLTGSVRGVERVRAIDGVPLPAAGDATARIAAALREAWRDGER